MSDFNKRAVFNTILILGSFVLFGILIFILAGRLEREAAKIVERKKELNEAARTQELLSQLRKDALEAERYRAQIDRLLPSKDEILYLREWMVNLGKLYGVEAGFTLGESKDPQDPDSVGQVGFRISVRGTYENVLGFIESLETSKERFLISLSNLDFRELGIKDYQISSEGTAFYK